MTGCPDVTWRCIGYGGVSDVTHLPANGIPEASTVNAAAVLDHSFSAQASGVTDRYIGHFSLHVYALEAGLQFVDPFTPRSLTSHAEHVSVRVTRSTVTTRHPQRPTSVTRLCTSNRCIWYLRPCHLPCRRLSHYIRSTRILSHPSEHQHAVVTLQGRHAQ